MEQADPHRWQRVEAILDQALEQPPEQRAPFLDQACGDDHALRREVESLLNEIDRGQASRFLEAPALAAFAEAPPEIAHQDPHGLLGQTLSHYHITGTLGSGGMGVVYKAEDTRLRRIVALKLLPPELMRQAEARERFLREAQAAAALNHPNICTIHDIGEAAGWSFIVMEHVEGRTLKQRMEAGPLPLNEALAYARQLAEGLGHAHAAGIVHRDVKPANVMVMPAPAGTGSAGRVKILDFGLAKLSTVSALTQTGTTLGTVAYMSPEQTRGEAVDHRTDVWSLGVVLYEMLTGERPFRGDYAQAIIYGILNEAPETVQGIRPEAPEDVAGVVEKLLQKDPAKRYQTVDDLLVDLSHVQSAGVTGGATDQGSPTRPIPSNLPHATTSFVGRAREVEEITTHLARVRLLTLTGPGGSGKTRLGLEVARTIKHTFPDGVFFVSLASIDDPELVAPAIAEGLGVAENPRRGVQDVVKDYLRKRRILLLLDNFEHVVPAASWVSELLTDAPHLKVLVTSQIALRVSAEQEFPVPPLAVPDPASNLSADALRQTPVVALFTERARAVRPDFAVTEATLGVIVRICQRLDGLPLAIELAAARVKILTPEAILSRLHHRFELLRGGARDRPSRHRTLLATLAWSYDLLSEEEKTVFQRLSIFRGGCTLEAIEAVCTSPPGAPVRALPDDAFEVLDHVASLVDKSLVYQQAQADGQPRYHMLETVRAYGLACLQAGGDVERMRLRHSDYYLAYAQEAHAHLTDAQQAVWLERLEREHDNLRAVLDASVQRGDGALGLRLALALWRFWEIRGHVVEGRQRFAKLLTLPKDSASEEMRRNALYATGVLADAHGDYNAARILFSRNLDMNRETDNPWGIAESLNNLAVVALREQDYTAAESLFQECCEILQALGHTRGVALSMNNLGNTMRLKGDLATARAKHEESLHLLRQQGHQQDVAWTLTHLGDVARAERRYDEAQAFFEKSIEMFRIEGVKWGIGSTLIDLGDVARDRSDYAAAHAYYKESEAFLRELGDRRGVARLLEGVAELAAIRKETRRTVCLLATAEMLREDAGSPRPPAIEKNVEHLLSEARRILGERTFGALWARGRTKGLEDALAYAFQSDDA